MNFTTKELELIAEALGCLSIEVDIGDDSIINLYNKIEKQLKLPEEVHNIIEKLKHITPGGINEI